MANGFFLIVIFEKKHKYYLMHLQFDDYHELKHTSNKVLKFSKRLANIQHFNECILIKISSQLIIITNAELNNPSYGIKILNLRNSDTKYM